MALRGGSCNRGGLLCLLAAGAVWRADRALKSAARGAAGSYAALDGKIPLYLAVREGRLCVANSEAFLGQILSVRASPPGANLNEMM
jgi:hypothetical protein